MNSLHNKNLNKYNFPLQCKFKQVPRGASNLIQQEQCDVLSQRQLVNKCEQKKHNQSIQKYFIDSFTQQDQIQLLVDKKINKFIDNQVRIALYNKIQYSPQYCQQQNLQSLRQQDFSILSLVQCLNQDMESSYRQIVKQRSDKQQLKSDNKKLKTLNMELLNKYKCSLTELKAQKDKNHDINLIIDKQRDQYFKQLNLKDYLIFKLQDQIVQVKDLLKQSQIQLIQQKQQFKSFCKQISSITQLIYQINWQALIIKNINTISDLIKQNQNQIQLIKQSTKTMMQQTKTKYIQDFRLIQSTICSFTQEIKMFVQNQKSSNQELQNQCLKSYFKSKLHQQFKHLSKDQIQIELHNQEQKQLSNNEIQQQLNEIFIMINKYYKQSMIANNLTSKKLKSKQILLNELNMKISYYQNEMKKVYKQKSQTKKFNRSPIQILNQKQQIILQPLDIKQFTVIQEQQYTAIQRQSFTVIQRQQFTAIQKQQKQNSIMNQLVIKEFSQNKKLKKQIQKLREEISRLKIQNKYLIQQKHPFLLLKQEVNKNLGKIKRKIQMIQIQKQKQGYQVQLQKNQIQQQKEKIQQYKNKAQKQNKNPLNKLQKYKILNQIQQNNLIGQKRQIEKRADKICVQKYKMKIINLNQIINYMLNTIKGYVNPFYNPSKTTQSLRKGSYLDFQIRKVDPNHFATHLNSRTMQISTSNNHPSFNGKFILKENVFTKHGSSSGDGDYLVNKHLSKQVLKSKYQNFQFIRTLCLRQDKCKQLITKYNTYLQFYFHYKNGYDHNYGFQNQKGYPHNNEFLANNNCFEANKGYQNYQSQQYGKLYSKTCKVDNSPNQILKKSIR